MVAGLYLQLGLLELRKCFELSAMFCHRPLALQLPLSFLQDTCNSACHLFLEEHLLGPCLARLSLHQVSQLASAGVQLCSVLAPTGKWAQRLEQAANPKHLLGSLPVAPDGDLP